MATWNRQGLGYTPSKRPVVNGMQEDIHGMWHVVDPHTSPTPQWSPTLDPNRDTRVYPSVISTGSVSNPAAAATATPAATATAIRNPQIAALQASLSQASAGDPQANAQETQLRALLSALQRGEGITVDPVTAGTDPAARAYRAARLREAEQARGAEAARLGASGLSGSGDFDARVAQLRENAGSDIAAYEGNATNQRRTEATQNALSSANATLADLDRQRLERQGRIASQQQLLQMLMAQDEADRANNFKQQEEARAQAEADRKQLLFNQTPVAKQAKSNQLTWSQRVYGPATFGRAG